MHGEEESKGRRPPLTPPPHPHPTHPHLSCSFFRYLGGSYERQHADSAAGYCLSNALRHSDNIVVHPCTLSAQARAREGAVRCFFRFVRTNVGPTLFPPDSFKLGRYFLRSPPWPPSSLMSGGVLGTPPTFPCPPPRPATKKPARPTNKSSRRIQ